MIDAVEILENNKLRRTNSRIKILESFFERRVALSEVELEDKLGKLCDRATIYRTLKTFLENGIIHKVIDEGNIVKYALCSTECLSSVQHQHDHVHFKCETCGETVCLTDLPIQSLSLPKGFTPKEANLLVLGTCDKCED